MERKLYFARFPSPSPSPPKLRTCSTVVHSSRHIANISSASASIRQAEGSNPIPVVASLPPLPLPLPPPPPHTFVRLRVYCAPPLSNQQQFRSSSTSLKDFGGSSSRDKAPQPPSPPSPLSTFTFFLSRTGREFLKEVCCVSQTISAVRRFGFRDGRGVDSGFLL